MKITRYAKFIVAAMGAAASALTVALGDDILTTTEGITVAVAILTAISVVVIPNAADKSAKAEAVNLGSSRRLEGDRY